MDWAASGTTPWRTGLDEFGEPVPLLHVPLSLVQRPKECLEFADYTFARAFGRPIGSYPPRAVLWDYIKGRVEKAGVRGWVRFRTPVREIDYSGKNGKSR